jgi:2,4-dienoyl-CoA reductase-like NADH-dependent reductase (Old Yellow Enzyme family)
MSIATSNTTTGGLEPLLQPGRTVGNPARLDHDRFRTALGELTEAVQNEGGRIAAQLHHTGRQNTRANIETGEAPISASDGAASAFGDPPRGLTLDEIPAIIDKYAQAGRRAVLAGGDTTVTRASHRRRDQRRAARGRAGCRAPRQRATPSSARASDR